MDIENYKDQVKQRVGNIQLRTILFSVMIIATLVIYFFINATFSDEVNWVDLAFLIAIQILGHFIYFPEGERFGTKKKEFIDNRKAYNDKAQQINKEHKFGDLRDYCVYEFEKRKTHYIENECNFIGITVKQLEIFKEYTENQIKELETYEYEIEEGKSQLIIFNKAKRKRLYKLLFKPLPVEENKPETIMSGIENDGYSSIHNQNPSYVKRAYITKILLALVLSTILAYIGITGRDGISIAEVFKIFMFAFTLFSTAITSFISGEKATSVFQNNFYLQLATFIDEFLECANKKEKSNCD